MGNDCSLCLVGASLCSVLLWCVCLGRATALRFAQEGANVVVVDMSDKGQNTVRLRSSDIVMVSSTDLFCTVDGRYSRGWWRQ